MTTKRQQLPRCLWQGLAPCWCSFRLPLTALGLARAIDITPAKQAGRRWDFRVLIGTGGRGGLMAEGAGFEPAIRFPVYTLSRRAPSTTRPPLRLGA